MAAKNAVAKAWAVTPSSDGKRWSAYPAGDKPIVSPSLGAYTSNYDIDNNGANPLVSPAIATQADGSSLLIFTALDLSKFFSVTHNKTGSVAALGSLAYTAWAPYGARMDWVQNLQGGSGQTASLTVDGSIAAREKTIFVVEVKNGRTLVLATPQELPASGAAVVTSTAVTVDAAAVVVCCAWGDANVSNPMDMGVHADSLAEGWVQIGDVTINNAAHIQGAVAARVVSVGGTYACKWNFTPAQRALFFTAAVKA